MGRRLLGLHSCLRHVGYSVAMAKVETLPWDVVDYLQTDEDQVAYLEAALEDSDGEHVAAALVNIARAKGVLSELEEALRRYVPVEAEAEGE